MRCNWESIRPSVWRCRTCGRVIAAARNPDGTLLEPRWDKMPPCGWQPLRYESNLHYWVEIYDKQLHEQSQRRFVCFKCQRAVILTGDDNTLKAILDTKSECLGKRRSPHIATRIGNYTRAVQRWIKAGRPVRDDARVAEIYDTKCRPCRHFDQNRETCTICGCFVRRSGSALRNKIKMATERCPADPPLWKEEVEVTDGDIGQRGGTTPF